MTWGKLCDTFHSHPKIIEAGNAAAGLFARLISWSNDHLTDGRIPRGVVLMYCEGSLEQIGALVDQRLLEESDGGYQIHDFLDHNDDAETVRKRNAEIRAKRSAAGKAGAAKRWGHKNNDLHGKNGKPIAKAMANGWQTDSPGPDPDPDPALREIGDIDKNDPSSALDLRAVEQIGFERYGQLGGRAQASISRLCPIYRHELDAAFATQGRSWGYAAKVISTYREEMAQGSGPPGSPTPRRKEGAFAQVTRELLEMEPPDGKRQLERIFGADVEIAGLLHDPGDGSGTVEG